MAASLRCITPSDIRGRVPDELNAALAARIAVAFVRYTASRHVALGRDVRPSSPELARAIGKALLAQGVSVTDLGLSGSEELYFAVFNGEAAGIDGGIMVTASHNPAEYNGMKLVGPGAAPICQTNGLPEIVRLAEGMTAMPDAAASPGHYAKQPDKSAYVRRILDIARPEQLPPFRIVVNSGNGCAGPVIDALAPHLPFELIRLHHRPDGRFPNGVPNPLLPENRRDTSEAVIRQRAALGIAWDGDFDRCFFFDEKGRFIESAYVVGLLAAAMLALHPGAAILHDARVVWNTEDMVARAHGRTIMAPSSHALIKAAMRQSGAIYGGEMSAHHYFRDFGCCDSGILPWLFVCRLMAEQGQPLSALVAERIRAFPVSGEISLRLKTPAGAILNTVRSRYADGAINESDGLSISYPDFRFNLRPSSTEPLLRLNVETRGDERLLHDKTRELLALLQPLV